MQRLNKSEFMKKVINDYYKRRYKKGSGDRESLSITITNIDNAIKNSSRGNKRLTSW